MSKRFPGTEPGSRVLDNIKCRGSFAQRLPVTKNVLVLQRSISMSQQSNDDTHHKGYASGVRTTDSLRHLPLDILKSEVVRRAELEKELKKSALKRQSDFVSAKWPRRSFAKLCCFLPFAVSLLAAPFLPNFTDVYRNWVLLFIIVSTLVSLFLFTSKESRIQEEFRAQFPSDAEAIDRSTEEDVW